MDGRVPWAPDAIEGVTVVREMPNLFGKWTYKYPRLQFLIDGLCYKPWIAHWEKNPVYSQSNGQQQAQALTLERLNTLAIISRINVLWMSSVIIIFIYLIAKFYYTDSVAAFFASLSLAVCFVFVYYSHTSCVDIPSMLWITAGVYFLIKSIYLNKMSDHLLAGLFFSFACCTKDAMLFYTIPFGIAYLVMRIHLLQTEGKRPAECIRLMLNRKTLPALVVFLFTFALLQNILFSPGAYWDRMGVWVGGRGVQEFNQGFMGQWSLLETTLKILYWSMGWPLAAFSLFSLIYTFRKHRLFNLLIVVLPPVFFYVFVSMRIKMSYERYYLPVMGLFFVPAGACISHLLSIKKTFLFPVVVLSLSAFFVLSFFYCIALDFELMNDSRNQTVQWLEKNVEKNTPVLSLIRYPYGPKLLKHGYPIIENWTVPPLEDLLANKERLPDYLVLTDNWYTIDTKDAKEFRQALLDNKGGYSKIIQFNPKEYLNPRKSVLSAACWPLTPHIGISPPVVVMKKNALD